MDQTIYFCPRCNDLMAIPHKMGDDLKARLVELRHKGRMLEAIITLRNESLGFGLAEAKMVVMHIAAQKDTCHVCGGKLSQSGATYCAACRSWNFNW